MVPNIHTRQLPVGSPSASVGAVLYQPMKSGEALDKKQAWNGPQALYGDHTPWEPLQGSSSTLVTENKSYRPFGEWVGMQG